MSKIKKPLVSVVILNWNRITDTLECLKSVRELSYPNYEIIVVDNGSTDGSKPKLQNIKDIVFVDNPINRGFTGGHIDGLAKARGEFIFILNNDAVIAPDYLTRAMETMESDDQIGAVGGRAYSWDHGHPAFDTSGSYLTFQNINPRTAEAVFSNANTEKKRIVNNVSGSAALIRRSVIDKIGYFYEPYFAYYEEADLFARMKRAGFKVIYDPRLGIWHKMGSSSSSYFQFYQLFKNRFVFAIRNFELRYLPAFLKDYIITGIKSTHLRFRSTENPSLHRGFSNAFFYSIISWPRALMSRFDLKHQLGERSNNYNSLIIADNIELSIVIDLSEENTITIKKFIDHYEKVASAYEHMIDIVICIPSSYKHSSKLRTARITPNYQKQSLDIGWLTAKGEYIVFSNQLLSIDGINKLFKKAVVLAQKNAWIEYQPNSSWSPIHRSLLINNGGLLGNSTDNRTFERLCLFAWVWDSKFLAGSSSVSKNFKDDYTQDTRRRVLSAKQDSVGPSNWNRFLERHYRIYQQRNLIKWLFSPKISLRLKLARTKNILFFCLTLHRKKLATELKHIRNEVVRVSYIGVDVSEQNKKCREIILHYSRDDNWKNLPVFIICRDRIDSLRILLNWLKKAGMKNIIIIDNDSLYPELTQFLKTAPHQVIATGTNIGHTIPWSGGAIRTLSRETPYIVTDPDVVPTNDCPMDVIEYLLRLHLRYFDHQKIGIGLKIDDLPKHFRLRESVINWESQFWKDEIAPGVFEAGVDTTFALYKPYNYMHFIHPSLRTGEPYVAHHLPWYIDSKKITPEERFYRDRLNNSITSWNVDELADRYKVEIKRQKKTQIND